MIGNFIADFIKGKQIAQYKGAILDGIQLHRKIDSFTDSHELVKVATKRLRPNYSRYASVIIDVFYDHFLAKSWMQYHNQTLLSFSEDVYSYLELNKEFLPVKVQSFLPQMKEHNWLSNYGNMYGLTKSLDGISRRAKFTNTLSNSVRDLHEHYDLYKKEFHEFFSDLIDFVEENIKEVNIAVY